MHPHTRKLIGFGLAGLVGVGALAAGGRDARTATASGTTLRSSTDSLTALTGTPGQNNDLQTRLSRRPTDPSLEAELGMAYLQRARETSDPAYYSRADELLHRSLKRDRNSFEAIVGSGSLALSRHQFPTALRYGKTALTFSRGASPAALGIIGDAEIELGRYPAGFATFARMAATRPGLVSFARASYGLELQGDLAGAIRFMRKAVEGGAGAAENTNWTRVQLAQLLLRDGRAGEAAHELRHALALVPGDPRAEATMGAVAIAQNRLASAEQRYTLATQRLPLPEFEAMLGDIKTARGDSAGAAEAYALVRAEQQLFRAAGGNADLESATFEAAHPGTLGAHAVVSLARRALAERPTVYAHDALAWALRRAGDCRGALAESTEAVRLGTADPLLHYHRGAIAACAGERGLARRELRAALAKNRNFHPLAGPAAARLLTTLGG